MNVLYLAKDIYTESVLKQTSAAFREFAEISISQNEENWLITFSQPKCAVGLLCKEYENYALDASFKWKQW